MGSCARLEIRVHVTAADVVVLQTPTIHSLENQFYNNMTAKNDKILYMGYILYRQLSRSLYKRLFYKIEALVSGRVGDNIGGG